MDTEKVIKNHTQKSKQVRKLKKDVKRLTANQIPLSLVKEKLDYEKKHKVDACDYQGLDSFDDEGWGRAEARREARIQLLEELIRESKKG